MTSAPNILLLEDQMLLAFELAGLLKRHGFSVLGPFANTDDALAALNRTTPDAAILDINLGNGKTSEPLASALMDRRLPFVFLTGYGSGAPIHSKFNVIQQLQKPARPSELIASVKSLISSSESGQGQHAT